MKLDQETIDRRAADNKLGYFCRIQELLAYRLNEQKGTFMLSRNDEVKIVSATVKKGRVLVTVDDGTLLRTFELTFNLVEQPN